METGICFNYTHDSEGNSDALVASPVFYLSWVLSIFTSIIALHISANRQHI